MISLSLLPKNNNELKEEERKSNDKISIFDKTDFNVFNSALFISEFQGKEEYSSENINKENINELSNSNKKKENNNSNKNIKFTYSLENCLTNELLDTIANDSNSSKKDKTSYEKEEVKEKDNNIENNNRYESINRTQDSLKIKNNFLYQPNIATKEKNNILFKLKPNNKKAVYEESINGFEYQLKFIEDSLHNVLPKSYKKSPNNINNYNNSCFNKNISNFYNNKKLHQISSTIHPNKFNNINNSNYSSSFFENEINNIYNFVSPFNSNSNNDCFFINYSSNNNGVYSNNNRIKYQTHKLKISNIKNFEWKCNYCNNINMGYRQTCINCRNNKKAKF